MSSERLARLVKAQEESRKARDEIAEKRKAIMDVAEDEGRDDLNESEDTEFRGLTAQIAEIDGQIAARDERIQELADEEKRGANAASAVRRAQLLEGQIRVGKEEMTYRQGGASYIRDLVMADRYRDSDAQARLERHAAEVRVDDAYKEYRDLSRTDGSGGLVKEAAVLA